MYEERFLQQAIEELESLREEVKELKRKLSVYENFVEQTKIILDKWDKERDEKGTIQGVYRPC